MKLFEYLYCKYYAFQVRVGHHDIAPFTAVLIMAFTIQLYFFALVLILGLLFPIEILNMNASFFRIFSIVFLFSLVIGFYFLLVYKGKYKEILKRSDSINKSNLWAILFPVVGFLLCSLAMFLKLVQNNGNV